MNNSECIRRELLRTAYDSSYSFRLVFESEVRDIIGSRWGDKLLARATRGFAIGGRRAALQVVLGASERSELKALAGGRKTAQDMRAASCWRARRDRKASRP